MSRRNPLSRQDIEEYNRQLQQELDDFELELIGEELDIAQEEIMDIDINDPMLTQIGQEFDVMSEELEEEEVLFVPSERIRGRRRRRREQRERTIKFNVNMAVDVVGRLLNVFMDSRNVDDSIAQVYERVKGLLGQRIRIITMDMNVVVTLSTNKTLAYQQLRDIFRITSDEMRFDRWYDNTGEHLIPVEIIPLSSVAGRRVEQKFAEGEVHCLFGSIMRWANKRHDDSNSKKQKGVWKTKMKHITKYIEKYKKGIPEKDIQSVCDKLQINIQIVLPLLDNNLIECRSSKKALKSFRYINSKLDHVDEYFFTNDDVEYIDSSEEMTELFNSIEGHKIWTRTKYDYTSILTDKKKYILRSDMRKTFMDFEYKTGLSNVKIDDIKDMKLSMFVRQGVHYNSMINMNNDITEALENDIWHIDMHKAYANYEKCFMYEGFCGKITDFRKTDRIVGIGLYRIDNICFDDCPDIVKKYFVDKEVLDVYVNSNVYPSPELKFLRKMGVTFDIIEGAWGNRMFFSIPEEMKKKNERGSSYYALYFGICNSQMLTKSYG
jgi:hypothetical protein